MRAAQLLFTLRRAHAQPNAPGALLLDLMRRGCGQDRDPLLAQNLRDFVGDIFILTHQQAAIVLNERDLAAKAAKHLCELQPDVAAPDDKQVFRECVQLHDGG